MSTKNLLYIIEHIDVRILCHECRKPIDPPVGERVWEKRDISDHYSRAVECPNCKAIGKFPAKLAHLING